MKPILRAALLAAFLFVLMQHTPLNMVMANETEAKRITLASTPEAIPAVQADGAIMTPERPGFRVEVLRSAGKQCGADVKFAPVPWKRALDMVRNGGADGAFSASFSEERAAFAAYPLKSGLPDTKKAMKSYGYSLYVSADSELNWDGKAVTGSGQNRKLLVEADSFGATLVAQIGLEPMPVSNYKSMVRMVAEKRAPGMVGIDTTVEQILAGDPTLATRIKKLQPPVGIQHAYVIFAKTFYAQNLALVECFWTALAEIRSKPAYQDLVKSYNGGKFIE